MHRPPTLSLPLTNFADAPRDWSGLLDRARLADEAGIDRLVVSDHVVLGEHLEAYERETFLTGPSGQWLEPLTTLAVIAGATTRVKLTTGVILAALRRPVVLAKAAATLDVLSGGRLELGVGVGWQKEEYEAAGLAFADRGRLLDETLELCRLLWREGPADLAGTRIWCEPKPVQPGGIPVWVSGRLSRPVLDRMVRFGDGWIPWGEWSDDVPRGVAVIRAAFEAAGRRWDGFGVRSTLTAVVDDRRRIDLDATLAPVPAMLEAGITDLYLHLPRPPDDRAAALAQLAGLVEGFRRLVAAA